MTARPRETATQAVETIAERLDTAQRTATAIPQTAGGFGVEIAYEIQHAVIARRLDRGEAMIGMKLGFTSRAKMIQMGVLDVIVGQLTNGMRASDGADIQLSALVHPRAEPEIAFRLGRAIDPGDARCDIESAVSAVAPALEIIDSRYRDFRFSLPDVIADNASAAMFAIGPWHSATSDLGNRAVTLSVDGASAEVGSTAAILGHPVRALRALVAMAHRHDFALPAGSILLVGAATAAVPFTASVIEARVAKLGRVSVRSVDS